MCLYMYLLFLDEGLRNTKLYKANKFFARMSRFSRVANNSELNYQGILKNNFKNEAKF